MSQRVMFVVKFYPVTLKRASFIASFPRIVASSPQLVPKSSSSVVVICKAVFYPQICHHLSYLAVSNNTSNNNGFKECWMIKPHC